MAKKPKPKPKVKRCPKPSPVCVTPDREYWAVLCKEKGYLAIGEASPIALFYTRVGARDLARGLKKHIPDRTWVAVKVTVAVTIHSNRK